jgi:hypothetical protein
VVLALALAPLVAAGDGSFEARYVGPTHDTSARFVDCHLDAPVSVDGVCVPLAGAASSYHLVVSDASGLPVPVHVLFRNATGIAVGAPDFYCGGAQDGAVPAGAVVMLVWPLPDDSVEGTGYCPLLHGTATTGTVSVHVS